MGLTEFAADGSREGPIAAERRTRRAASIAVEWRRPEVIDRGA